MPNWLLAATAEIVHLRCGDRAGVSTLLLPVGHSAPGTPPPPPTPPCPACLNSPSPAGAAHLLCSHVQIRTRHRQLHAQAHPCLDRPSAVPGGPGRGRAEGVGAWVVVWVWGCGVWERGRRLERVAGPRESLACWLMPSGVAGGADQAWCAWCDCQAGRGRQLGGGWVRDGLPPFLRHAPCAPQPEPGGTTATRQQAAPRVRLAHCHQYHHHPSQL